MSKYVYAPTAKLARLAVGVLEQKGYKVELQGKKSSAEEMAKFFNFDGHDNQSSEKYPCVGISNDGVIERKSGINDGRTPLACSWEEFFAIPFAPKIIEVILTDDYTARVTKDGIQVGCQTISLDKLDALVAARAEVLKG
jgi:hypothetical protein